MCIAMLPIIVVDRDTKKIVVVIEIPIRIIRQAIEKQNKFKRERKQNLRRKNKKWPEFLK